jgi:hypothetical protein
MRHLSALLLPLLLAAGCSEAVKSPTSPSAATPSANETAPVGTALKATAPALMSPANGTVLNTRQPTLSARGAAPTVAGADASQIRHRFQLLANDGRVLFDSLVNGTSWTVPQVLPFETNYRWQVRAEAGATTTSWTPAWTFTTPEEPPTILGRGPYPTDGPSIAKWVAERWPQYLVGGISEEQRFKNMEFLRDRMIEAGRCGGMDLAWNLKRGIGPHSHDALAWRDGGRVRVVDLALASKDPRFPMQLQWIIVGGDPGYDTYTNHFVCKR